jgi:farnesyl-diphosphate farnesyltransferase
MTYEAINAFLLRGRWIRRASTENGFRTENTVNVATRFARRSTEPLSDDEIEYLLLKTSRTFAVCIPMLPDPLRRQVGLAYLLLRIADTIEDSSQLIKDQKSELLSLNGLALQAARTSQSDWSTTAIKLQQHCPTTQKCDAQLFSQAARVIASTRLLEPAATNIIFSKAQKSSEGMRDFVSRGDARGSVQLDSFPELQEYCYCVAGLVGEMLTELFCLFQAPLRIESQSLNSLATSFGEALQLVNILKDSANDSSEGRRFIPTNVPRTLLIAAARKDLDKAERYIELLRKLEAHSGIVQFTQFPVRLAALTLDRLKVEGPDAKVGRTEVTRILAEITGNHLGVANGEDRG